MQGIDAKIQSLPPELQREVEDFVAFLMEKRASHKPKAPALKWAGVLKGVCGESSSVDLQHALSYSRAAGK